MTHPSHGQLITLGYRAGDRIFVRLLLPKNIPLDVAERRRMAFEPEPGKIVSVPIDGYLTLEEDKISFTRLYKDGKQKQKYYRDGLAILTTFNQRGYGVYFVVNPGGRDDADITYGRSLFYECDDATKAEQWERLRQIESELGCKASLVVETAKSLHCYFVLPETLNPDDWKRLQQRLIQRQSSDPAIFNPSRLMRLAGFLHWKWDKEACNLVSSPVTIAQHTDSVFSLAQFDTVLPPWDVSRWDKHAQVSDRIATEAGDNPWDIRNLANYLEGLNTSGRRRGWWTCKCPAHNGESDNSLHINEATGAFKCHAGCDPKAVYDAALAIAKAAGHEVTEGKRSGKGRQHPIPLPTYTLSYPIAVLLNSEYLGDVAIPADQKVVALKSRKGGGKTYTIERMVAEAHAQGRPVLVISYRRQLARQLAHRFGIAYKEEMHLSSSVGDRLLGLSLCIDSLHPNSEAQFNAADWCNALIIFDECESVFWHLVHSKTCTGHRLVILQQLKQLLRGALSPDTGGRVVLADADLSDISVDFVLRSAERTLTPYIICNEWRAEKGWDVFNYSQVEGLLLALEEAIASGGHHLILTTAQKSDSKWSAQNIEKRLQTQFPGKSILRIDSETVADPAHPAYGCIEHINATMARYDIVICTPVVESGVSMELFGHFSGVWCIAPGVTPESGVRQFLARLRDNDVPRHLYTAEIGCNFAFVAGREHDAKSLLETAHKVGRVNLSLIKDASFQIDINGNVTSNPAALEAWGKFGARINRGLHRYRDAVVAGLEAEGHTVIPVEALAKADAKDISKRMAEIRDENHQAECQAIAETEPPTTQEEYELLKQQRSKTTEQRRSARHWELQQKYQVEVTADLALKDSQGWHSAVRNHYYLTLGSEFLKDRDRERFQAIAVDGVAWVPDINRRSLSSKIEALNQIGFTDLLNRAIAGDELTALDPAVELFHQRVMGLATPKGYADPLDKLSQTEEEKRRAMRRKSIEALIGIEAQPTAISTLQEYFDQILGFRLMRTEQRTICLLSENGRPVLDEAGKPMKKRIWVYRYPTAELLVKAGNKAPERHPLDGRQAVMDAWLKRDKAKHGKAAEPRLEPVLVAASVLTATEPFEPELHTKTHIDLFKNSAVQCVPEIIIGIPPDQVDGFDWSDLPLDCRRDFADMWCGAENDEQRGAILQAIGELRRAIAWRD